MIQYHFFETDKRLSTYISAYALMEVEEGISSPLLSPPNGLTGFLIRIKSDKNANVFAEDFEGKPIAHQHSYVIGQTTFPITGYVVGQLTFLVVFFHPLGMHQLFGCKMNTLTNKSVDLIDFLGVEKAELLLQKLKLTDDRNELINILNYFFMQQKTLADDYSFLNKALQLIHKAEGNINIKTIEEKIQINRRTLERHFNDKVGISPKVYAQIFRFKCAMNYLQANPKTTWSALTYNNGFYDQPHLIKYFKEYLKVSPNKLVQLDVEFINHLLKY